MIPFLFQYFLPGKIGHDGKEIQPDQSPQVNGFSFVGTPSPAPGAAGESPMMTWGELDSTPARLDPNGEDILPNTTPGPVFRVRNQHNVFLLFLPFKGDQSRGLFHSIENIEVKLSK